MWLCHCAQDQEEVNGRYSKQKMVLGTHTSEGEQNYLMLAEVPLLLTCCTSVITWPARRVG